MKTFNYLVICILMISSLSSQGQSFTSKKTVELGGEFSFTSQTTSITGSNYGSNDNSDSYDVLMFSPYVGLMIGQGFELGFMPSIAKAENLTIIDLFFAPSYNIQTGGNAYPYLEGLVGYSSYSNSDITGGLGIGVGGGVKVTIGSSALFLFNIRYIHQSFEEKETYYAGYPYYTATSTTVKISLNTLFAGLGFHIFIPSKSSKPISSPGK